MSWSGFPWFEGTYLPARPLSGFPLPCFPVPAQPPPRAFSNANRRLGSPLLGTVRGMTSAHPYHTAVPPPKNSPSPRSPLMDDTLCRHFFLEPTQPLNRRFAALHAFFVEGLSPQAISARFGLAYHTVRSWVRDFRAQCRAGQIPPFSPRRTEGDRAAAPTSS